MSDNAKSDNIGIERVKIQKTLSKIPVLQNSKSKRADTFDKRTSLNTLDRVPNGNETLVKSGSTTSKQTPKAAIQNNNNGTSCGAKMKLFSAPHVINNCAVPLGLTISTTDRTIQHLKEPHQFQSASDSFFLAPPKDSKGDQVRNSHDDKKSSNANAKQEKKASLDFLMEPRNLKEVSLHNIPSLLSNSSSNLTYTADDDSLASSPSDYCCNISSDETGLVREVEYEDVWRIEPFYAKKNEIELKTNETQTSSVLVEEMDYISFCHKPSIVAEGNARKFKMASDIKEIKMKASSAQFKTSLSSTCNTPLKIQTSSLPEMENFENGAEDYKAGCMKRDLKRKGTYTICKDEKLPEDIQSTSAGDKDKGIPTCTKCRKLKSSDKETWRNEIEDFETIKSRVFVQKLLDKKRSSAVFIPDFSTNIFEVYPQSLLLIPDTNHGGYVGECNIANKMSKNLLAFKICLNRSAHSNYVIEPKYGIIPPESECRINIRTKQGDDADDFSQLTAAADIVEIKVIQAIEMSTENMLLKFWNLAEAKHPNLISSVTISNIKILEPCNMAILGAIDEGPERNELKKILTKKYNKVLLPKMIKKCQLRMTNSQLISLENTVQATWNHIRHLDFYFDIGFNVFYAAVVYWIIFPNVLRTTSSDIQPTEKTCDDGIMCEMLNTLTAWGASFASNFRTS